jgi:hypothetical protein
MPLTVYIDRHHCYNKEVVSTGNHLNFYYIHDSVLFLLIAGGVLRQNIYISLLGRNQTSLK